MASSKKNRPTSNRKGRQIKFWLIRRVVLPLVILPIKLLMRTWRLELESGEFDQMRRPEGPVTLAVFHGMFLSVLGLVNRQKPGERFCGVTMISPSRDGQLLADVFHRFGQGTVEGSSRSKGASGLLALIDATKKGQVGTIAVDGPRGPRCVPQAGIFALSKATKSKLYFLVAAPDNAIRFKSWDRAALPKPFSRVRFRLELFHDYAQGDYSGDERVAFQEALLKKLVEMGEPVDDIQRIAKPEASDA